MAAIARSQSRLNFTAPPPSPIANAKGLKSAAVNDEILSEYLDKTLHIPDLSLPEAYFPVNNDNHNRQIPAEVDLNSLISRDDDSIRKLLESVTKFGVFRLIGHGISGEELRSVVKEAELVFRISKEKKRNRDLSVSFGLKKVNREELVWLRTEKEKEEDVTLREEIGSDKYRSFCMRMDGIYDRLEVIAGSVGQILLSYMKQPQEKGIRNREPVLCLYRYTHDRFEEDQLTPRSGHPEQVKKHALCFDHALSLYVSIGDQQFHVDTGNGSLSFNTCSGAIVGTIRKLEEWSQGEFKRVQGEPIMKRGIDESPSYSIEFMFTPSTLNYNPENDQNPKTEITISLFDQFMIAIAISLLYTFLTYIL